MKRLLALLLLAACHSHSELKTDDTLQDLVTKTETVDAGAEDVVIDERWFSPGPPLGTGSTGAVSRPPGVSTGSVPPAAPATGELLREKITTKHISPKTTTTATTEKKDAETKTAKTSDLKPSAGCTSAAILWAIAVLAGLGLAGFLLKKFS